MYSRPSNRLWYVVPVLFGILGGIATWFFLRRNDPILAKNCLLVGVISSAVSVLLYFALGSTETTGPPAWDS